MASPQQPVPVKLFIAVLFKDQVALEHARRLFVVQWGAIDFEGGDRLFDTTDYYEREMGKPLYRRIVSFAELAQPPELVEMKLSCNAIEDGLKDGDSRTVNCDCGYLDHNKVVLASAKEAGQKIYIDKGIYADLSGRYKDGKYRPFEWSFPDFKDGRYDADLALMRSVYLGQMKQWRRSHHRVTESLWRKST
jgi:Domain of unknown function (DUF4416)